MWKWLHPWAKPEAAYRLAGRIMPWFAIPATILILVGLTWGLLFAPVDYQQGHSYRIIFLHVPTASWSMGIYASMAVAALIGLVWQLRMADLAAKAMAPIGAVYTLCALITGACWGKPMWGTWWVWDARLTSELILLFIYLGIMALYSAFEDPKQGGRAAGILTLVGVVNLPIIKFSVEWWNTLHQGATISKVGKPSMSPEMLAPLLISIAGFALLFGALAMVRFRNELLTAESRRPWVQALALGKPVATSPEHESSVGDNASRQGAV